MYSGDMDQLELKVAKASERALDAFKLRTEPIKNEQEQATPLGFLIEVLRTQAALFYDLGFLDYETIQRLERKFETHMYLQSIESTPYALEISDDDLENLSKNWANSNKGTKRPGSEVFNPKKKRAELDEEQDEQNDQNDMPEGPLNEFARPMDTNASGGDDGLLGRELPKPPPDYWTSLRTYMTSPEQIVGLTTALVGTVAVYSGVDPAYVAIAASAISVGTSMFTTYRKKSGLVQRGVVLATFSPMAKKSIDRMKENRILETRNWPRIVALVRRRRPIDVVIGDRYEDAIASNLQGVFTIDGAIGDFASSNPRTAAAAGAGAWVLYALLYHYWVVYRSDTQQKFVDESKAFLGTLVKKNPDNGKSQLDTLCDWYEKWTGNELKVDGSNDRPVNEVILNIHTLLSKDKEDLSVHVENAQRGFSIFVNMTEKVHNAFGFEDKPKEIDSIIDNLVKYESANKRIESNEDSLNSIPNQLKNEYNQYLERMRTGMLLRDGKKNIELIKHSQKYLNIAGRMVNILEYLSKTEDVEATLNDQLKKKLAAVKRNFDVQQPPANQDNRDSGDDEGAAPNVPGLDDADEGEGVVPRGNPRQRQRTRSTLVDDLIDDFLSRARF